MQSASASLFWCAWQAGNILVCTGKCLKKKAYRHTSIRKARQTRLKPFIRIRKNCGAKAEIIQQYSRLMKIYTGIFIYCVPTKEIIEWLNERYNAGNCYNSSITDNNIYGWFCVRVVPASGSDSNGK